MPKAARVSALGSAPAASSKPSKTASKPTEDHPLVSIALFSGLGLLASLVAILMGAQGDWF